MPPPPPMAMHHDAGGGGGFGGGGGDEDSAGAGGNSDRLRFVRELPGVFAPCFGFAAFNIVQSECFDAAFGSDEALVVAAPTGSGKTGADCCNGDHAKHAGAHASACALSCPSCGRMQAQLPVPCTLGCCPSLGHTTPPIYCTTTGVMELALVRLWAKRVGADGRLDPPGGRFKAVYLAPIRCVRAHVCVCVLGSWKAGQGAAC